ncbi:MAG: LytTR family DNA-binding domain-containing protein [Paraprevotella sp.]|nr:LytTR family DNA-binding domain-containing protein [Paraprevotella sp.]
MIKCIAIDDEPIALSIISQYCQRRGGIELETYAHPLLGMQRIRETHPDVVFLDIEMGKTSGIELAKELQGDCCVVFTTAYAHYALEGFEVDAVDFLHKPFFYDRFERAMQKVETRLRANRLLASSESSNRKIILKVKYKNTAVPLDEILYIEAMENYVKVHRVDKTTLISQLNIKSVLSLLPENEFIRIHRSFVVPVDQIESYNRHQLT